MTERNPRSPETQALYDEAQATIERVKSGELLMGPGDRIRYVIRPEYRDFIHVDELEVLYVEVDDNGHRPALRITYQTQGRPDIKYWELINQAQIDRWYLEVPS